MNVLTLALLLASMTYEYEFRLSSATLLTVVLVAVGIEIVTMIVFPAATFAVVVSCAVVLVVVTAAVPMLAGVPIASVNRALAANPEVWPVAVSSSVVLRRSSVKTYQLV